MPPSAALVALTLRARQRAWLFGESVSARVAESQIVERTLARTRCLDPATVPDVIEADGRAGDLAPLLVDLATRGAPPAPPLVVAREKLVPPPRELPLRTTVDAGAGKAAVRIAHGAVRAFYPYFDVVGDTLDTALPLAFDRVGDAPARADVRDALGMLLHELHDGHATSSTSRASPSSPASRRSTRSSSTTSCASRCRSSRAYPGDEILEVGGVPMATKLRVRGAEVHETLSLPWNGLGTEPPNKVAILVGPHTQSLASGTDRVLVTAIATLQAP